MLDKPPILSLFSNSFKKFNKTLAVVLNPLCNLKTSMESLQAWGDVVIFSESWRRKILTFRHDLQLSIFLLFIEILLYYYI